MASDFLKKLAEEQAKGIRETYGEGVYGSTAYIPRTTTLTPPVPQPVKTETKGGGTGTVANRSSGLVLPSAGGVQAQRRSYTTPRTERTKENKRLYGMDTSTSRHAAVVSGNIDLNNRPVYRNDDGSISTVDSVSFGIDGGREVLVPTIGRDAAGNPVRWSDEEAWQHYADTGEHLGIFNTVEDANNYAQSLHKQQEKQYSSRRTVSDIYNDAATMARWNELAGKDTLTAEEKKEARAATKELHSAFTHWNAPPTGTDMIRQTELTNLYNSLLYKSNALASGFAGAVKALGIDWLSDRLTGATEKVLDAESPYTSMREITGAAQKANPAAFTVGSIAGSTAEMLGISGIVGNAMKGVEWFTKAPQWIQRAISSGITFGASGLQSGVTSTQTKEEWDAAEQEKAALAAEFGAEYTPKEYSVGKQLANVGISTATGALAGAAGGALETAFGLGTSKALVRYGLQYNTLFRALANGINGVGFAAGSTAIQEASKYLQYPEGYTASPSEIASNMAVAFLFSSVSSIISDVKAAPQNRENLLKMMDELTREYAEVEMKMAGMTEGPRRETAQKVTQLTARIRNSIATGRGMSGVSNEIKALAAALDIIDDRMAAIIAGGNGLLGAADIMAQAEAAGFTPSTTLMLPAWNGASRPTNLEQAVQIVGANVPAPMGETATLPEAPAQANELPAWYAAYQNAPRPIDQPMQQRPVIPTPPTPAQAAQEIPQQAETAPAPPVPQKAAVSTTEAPTQSAPPVPTRNRTETQTETQETERETKAPSSAAAAAPSPRGRQGNGLRIADQGDAEILWTAPKDNGGWKRRYNGPSPMTDALRATNPELLEAYLQEGTEGTTDTPIIDAVSAVYEDVRQGTISPMAGAELVNQMYSATQDPTMRRAYLSSLYNAETGNLLPQAVRRASSIDELHRNGGLTVGQAQTAAPARGEERNEIAPAAEATGAEAGNGVADGGRGGIPGQRAGEPDGRVARLTEARSAVSQFDTASRRRSDAKNLPPERVNARDHIAEAAEGSTITFAPPQMVQQDKELRTVKRRLESITGRKVYYTLGGIRRTGADGKTGTARGAITPNGIYLRCDDDSASVTQLAGHELYHYYEEQFPGLHDRVRQRITERYSEEEFREIAGKYAEKLGRLNGMAEDMDAEAYEAMLDRIESEIFADAFGNINYFRLGADRFTDAARETVNETAGRETAAATERRTGPPEKEVKTDFSMAEDTDAEYMAAAESGDMETAQRMVDEAAKAAGYDYVRYTRNRLSPKNNDADYYMFTEQGNEETVRGVYGDNKTVASGENTIEAADIIDPLRKAWEGYAEDNDLSREITDEELNPDDIVISAGVWDDRDFVTYLFNRDFFGMFTSTEVPALKTNDGLIVFGNDHNRIKSAEPVTYDDDGNIIPLSERFNPEKQDIRWSMTEDEDAPEKDYFAEVNERTEELRAEYKRISDTKFRRQLMDRDPELFQKNEERRKQIKQQIKKIKNEEASVREIKAELEKIQDVEYQKNVLQESGIEGVKKTDARIKELKRRLQKLKGSDTKEEKAQKKQTTKADAQDETKIPESAAEYARMKREGGVKSPPAKVNKQKATIAKKDLRNTIISEFGIPDGRKAEIGKLIDAYAERAYKDGKLTETDRRELFDKLYSEGVMTVPADDAFRAAREIVKGGRIYVPESVKHEYGDDWSSFRRDAFAEGIYLTNNESDRGWDSWNAELSAELPGLFAEDETDPRKFLERVVHLAREGRDQELSLAEYAANVIGSEYVSEDELLDNMERKLDWALRSYADKAGLEIWLRNKTEEKLAKQREQFGERLDRERAQRLAREQKEREKRKEAARRQSMNRELQEMQQRTLKQLQWLSRNRQRFSGDMQDRLNEILSDIDVYAISAADEAHLDKASGKTWRELADIYKDARENDPNFLPSEDLKRIVARLDNRKIGDMDIDAVTDLYKAAVGLRTELYNRNNLIGSELHETFQEVYDQVKDEMGSARGGYQSGKKGKAQKFFSDLQLTPMNVLERMAGWNKDSAWYMMAKQLERGERAQRKFKTDSARMLAPFLEEHKKWVKKADGQGKDAIWYEVEVPELLELGMGDKPIFGKTVKVWMTPAQKVHMYLESQNYDNLRHMTGGRTFADKELYSKGKRAEAFAQGKTIRLAPETVKNLVKDLTPEEKALADALRPFYNEFSKKEINRVSNLLLGYDKAMEGDYAPIYTNQNYTKSEPGIFDTTAEGVGNLKSRVYSSNPSLNISALDAFEKSVDRTSRYVGLAIPVRNMNTLMNWREKGNSMADVLTHKWGEEGKRFVNDLLTELQSGRETNQSSIEKLTNAALSRYISAVFGANPSIVAKQFASYPLAAAYLGWGNMPRNIPRAAQVDTDLISKYTGEYDYRKLGYAMPETATLKDNPGKLQERGPLNFIFGGGAITWMDGFTVRTLWTWAENKVNKEQPGLERGSQEQIDAGNSEYYKAVAAEFEEALSRSQPMYDTMHRANIMRESNPITRAFTLFKTVPMQEYNMLRQAIGEAQYAKEAKLDKETQAAARQKAGRAFAGILTGNLMIGAITILNALWKNRGKKYRDEDGELSAEKLIAEAGKQYFKDAAGLVILGDTAADILSSVLFGDKWYGLETPGMEQIESILEQTVKAGNTVKDLVRDSIEVLANGGNWAQYMADHSDKYISAVDSVARTLGTYATGLPIDNVKAYLLGAVQWLSPQVNTAYEDALKKADRSGLKGLRGASLEIRTKHILQERAGSAEDSTVEALAGLYEAGYKDAIPAAQVTKITVDGEERQLNLAQQQTYKRAWQSTVGGSIDELVGSKDFQNADEATRAKMLKKLYDLANKKAASALFDDYEDSAIGKADAYTAAGASLADYAAMSGAVSGQKRAESYETILGSDMSDEAKLAAIGNIIGTDMVTETGNPTQWARLNTAVKDGLSVDDAVELMQEGLLDDYDKWRGSDAKKQGIGWKIYRRYKTDTGAMSADKDEDGKSVSGSKKAKVLKYINGLSLTAQQKDALYYDAGYAESGIGDTPWHGGGGSGDGKKAPARMPTLRLPEAPKAEKPGNGLRISAGEPALRQSSGLRIGGAQTRGSGKRNGLRLPAIPADAPRRGSGLRIGAK